MKIGVPKGLLYPKYHRFAETFIQEIGAELVISPDTNKDILNEGTHCCVDEACLPIKVFHGHVSWLKGRCEAILIPRIMGIRKNESLCPYFCGLIEMVKNNITGLPLLIDSPIFSTDDQRLSKWASAAGGYITKNKKKINVAYHSALKEYAASKTGYDDQGYPLKICLIGHVYNIFDKFINMNLKKKLNDRDIGVITTDVINQAAIEASAESLFKKPFWTFARGYYGAAVHICQSGKADGIIYLSAFSCGIDSVFIELVKGVIGDLPIMVLKLDEHTGEAGFDTRIEAFSDMLKRRWARDHNFSQYGQCSYRRGNPLPGLTDTLCRS